MDNREVQNGKEHEPVPYWIHQGDLHHIQKCNERLLIALIVAVIALVVNNCAWIVYEGVVHGNSREIVYETETDS